MPIELAIIFGALAALGTACSIIFGLALFRRNRRLDTKADTKETTQAAVQECAVDVNMQADIRYIMRGVDDIKVEQRLTRDKMEGMSERITRVEESAKSMHRRLDEHILGRKKEDTP